VSTKQYNKWLVLVKVIRCKTRSSSWTNTSC